MVVHTSKYDVIVIGAGASGLASASTLKANGYRTCVIESRDRIGGRVSSVPLENGDTDSVELGAELIHGEGGKICEIARQIGYELTTGVNEPSYWNSGKYYDSRSEFAEQVEKVLRELASEYGKDISLDSALAELNTLGSDAVKAAARGALLALEGASGNTLSLSGLEWGSGAGALMPRNYFLKGRYCAVLEEIARGLELLTSTTVKLIDWSKNEILIRDSEGREFQCKKLICTLPLGVLKSGQVKFFPELPKTKIQAIEAIPIAQINKLILGFNEECIPKIDYLESDGAFQVMWLRPSAKYKQLLVAFATDVSNSGLANLNEEDAIALAHNDLQRIFGRSVQPFCTFERFINWSVDPNSLGAYSYNCIGLGNSRAILAEAVCDKLYFAGEATCYDTDHGTVHGAYASGVRAANEIMQIG